MITTIGILPEGVEGKTLYTPEEYEAFRRWWRETVVPELDEADEKRRKSLEDLFNQPPRMSAA